ncbi:MAG: hypothetical protein B9S32_08085 [Verrucomicrobia bacterium Tous-C9LFEB]|nr:MAG: hypothetical protein B9S32_08085 [Verrucomicrobia bacterium Tous-C9LFEB]
MHPSLTTATLTETLTTPIEYAGDVLVIGAGSAGVGAALAAARSGKKTTLVDPAGFIGGTLVSGIPIGGCYDGEKQVVKGIFHEMWERLHALDGCDDHPDQTTWLNIDPEKLKIVLLEMLGEAGVQLRLHTFFSRASMNGSSINAAIVEGKGGRLALQAGLYIDTTGDADLAISAGVPIAKGRTLDGKMQPMSLIFAVGNIDLDRFQKWGGYGKMESVWNEISVREHFRNPRRGNLSGMWGSPERSGERTFNVTRVTGLDGSDAHTLSRAEVEGRRQAWEFLYDFLQPHIPGFEKSFVSWTSAKIGVRETRRIVGEYILTRDDIWNFVKFPDAINCGSYPIDIHSPTDATTDYPTDHFYGGKYWTIPYRSLVPLKVDNLLVAGRCLSATHEALSAVRVMANTMGMGEAAGFAAALALQHKTTPRRLDARLVQDAMLQHGAWLGD